MNVLLLVDCYLPSTKSSAKLVHDLARELVSMGHSTAVVTQDPDAPGIRTEDGVEVVRVQAGAIKGAKLWTRGLNEARLSSRIWSSAKDWFRSRRFDLVVYYSPTIFFGALVRRLKRLYGCRTYLILRDIFPQWAVDAGVLRKGPAYWYFKLKERQQYDAADVIGVQSPANLAYFEGSGRRTEVLYNWMRVEPRPSARSDFRRAWGLEGKTLFFYGGNLGVAQDVDNLVRLARGLRSVPEAHVLLVGEGSEAPRLRSVVEPNLTLKDALSQDDYLKLVSEADVGLISLDRRLRTQNFPGKLLSYLHAGIPTLASLNPGNDLGRLLESSGAGLACENGDDAGFLERALRLANDPALRSSMGAAARRLLEERFSARAAAEQVLEENPGFAERLGPI